MRRTFLIAAIVPFLLGARVEVAPAAEIVVLSSGASRSAVSQLVPRFNAAAEHRARVQFANNPVLDKQIRAGAQFDVLIIEPDFIDDLAAAGHIARGSRVDLARVGMALGARMDASPADVSTLDAFVDLLRKAESIAYTADGHSGTVFLRTLEHLGLLEVMKPKLRPAVGRTAASLVLKNEAQMWAGPISTPSPGARIVGRFPEEIQTYVGISAAISAASAHPEVARSFVEFLRSSEAKTVFADRGFRPVHGN